MKDIYLIIFILLFSCSGSKEFDNTPTPIGGEERVRSVMLNEFGNDYYNLAGYKLSLNISLNKKGIIKSVSSMYKPANWMDSYDWKKFYVKIKNAFMDHIQFTPATKYGKLVSANFRYYFTF